MAVSGQLWEAAAYEWAAHVRGGGDKQFVWNAPPFFDSLPPPRGLTVEIGCGEGRVTRELRARGYDVVGFDVSATLVALASEADPAGEYAVADAATLPIGDGVAALVVAFNVLHQIGNLPETIAEVARVLAPRGHFCFANAHPLATAGDFAADSDDFVVSSYCESFARTRPLGSAEITHFHRPLAEYVAALAAAGLRLESLGEVPTVRRAAGRIPAYLHVRAASRGAATSSALATPAHAVRPLPQTRLSSRSDRGGMMTAATASEPKTSGRAEANGVDYYYEIHGQGEPLLLLHGGLGSIDMFGPVLPMLAEHREVVGVDLHGHGRTTLGERKIDLLDMGDDIALILDRLGYDQVDVMGYSLGGGVAFRLAAQHPDRVRRLVLVSVSYSTDGLHPEMRPQQGALTGEMADAMKGTPMYDGYMAVAPHPEDFPRLLDRMGELMGRSSDWSDDIPKLTMPVMLVYGDSDMFRPDHMVDFYKRLGGGLKDAGWQREHQSPNRLAILPDLTHYDVFLDPDLARTVLPFLDGKSKSHSWAAQAEQAT